MMCGSGNETTLVRDTNSYILFITS